MNDFFDSLNYVMEPGRTLTKISYPDYADTYTLAYPVLPGIFLYLQHMHTKEIPFIADDISNMVIINYGINGRSEQTLTDGKLTYVSSGDLAVSTLMTRKGSRFPSGIYEGVEISLDLSEFSKSGAASSVPWGADAGRLKEICGKEQFFEARHISYIDQLMQKIWDISRDDSQNEYAKVSLWVQDFLRYLCYEEIPQTTYENLTYNQADIALEYEGILTSNLSEHISAKTVAGKFHISETSLKNYFRIEFGENVSSYMKKYRMRRAAEWLLDGRENIAEIAQKAGYTNPSKFAAVFRSCYGMGPFEYRKKHQKI